MKKITILIFAFSLVLPLAAQQITSELTSAKANYLQKSNNQKAIGWLLTGAGTIGLIATLSADAGQAMSGMIVTVFSFGTETPEYKSYTSFYLLSAAGIAGGIILLAESSKNKRKAKAAQVFISMENSEVVKIKGLEYTSFPVVGLKIRL